MQAGFIFAKCRGGKGVFSMRADELAMLFDLDKHMENGRFLEKNEPPSGQTRSSSGCMYYYVAPGELTKFHRLDCDEYWCYNAGAVLELWLLSPDGSLRIEKCGVGSGAEPMVRVPKGTVFASRHAADCDNGTFLSLITVPRFQYSGMTLYEGNALAGLIRLHPALAEFWSTASEGEKEAPL